jgi:Uncharacterised nucleotidyltransferase
VSAPWAGSIPEFTRRGLFPTREQFLVLKAALGARAEALEAYADWRRTLDVAADFDREIMRLVPLLYDNLRRLGVEDDLTGRLKGAYRLAWVRAHRLAAETRPLLDDMVGAGLRVMAVKGAPLGLLYYGNPALRPMGDFDFVVPAADAMRVVEFVASRGYQPWRPVNDDTFRYRHAMGFKRADGHEFDLHWHVLFDFCDDGADQWFWTGAEPFDLLGQRVWAPDPTRMLLHTIIHGIRWNEEPPVRWIADAVQILRRAGDRIDWPALVEFTERRGVCRRMWLGLTYLREHFGAPIPPAAIERLGRRPSTWVEWLENHTILRDYNDVHAGAFGPLLAELAPFSRYARGLGALQFVDGFSRYLRYVWGLERRRDIAGYLGRRCSKRFRRIVHAPA